MISRPAKKLTIPSILVLQAYWIGLSFMWNSLHIIILPAVLANLVPPTQKNTYLGLLTFVGLIIAMIVQPISGSLSDRWVSKWGRRRPLMVWGTAFDFLFLAFLGLAGGIGWIAIGYICLQFSSNVAHGPLQGLMPDQVPDEQLGQASGFKNLMDMGGLIAASLIMGRIVSPDVRQPASAIATVAVVLAAAAATTLLGVKEKPSIAIQKPAPKVGWFDAFHVDLHKHGGFAWLIASRLLFLSGIYGIQAFAQYYVRDVLNAPNPVKLTGDLLATITLALTIFALAGGWLGDRFGHKVLSLIASLVGALGCILLMWARTPGLMLVFGSLVGMGIGLFLTSNWALANQLAPSDQAGKFLGLTNLATAGAGAIGRLEGPGIDILNNAKTGAWWGYTSLFLLGAVFMLASALLLIKVPAKREPERAGSLPDVIE